MTDQRPPITDSPWFWLIVFSCSALAGLVAIAPKYSVRQAGVERKSAAREEVARRRHAQEPLPGDTAADLPVDPAEQRTLQVPLVTLVATMLLLVGTIAFSGWKLRGSMRLHDVRQTSEGSNEDQFTEPHL